MTLAAALLISSAAFSQESEQQGQRPKFDKSEMVKHRTDEIVKKYNLNEEQASKLLDLNTQYADKLGNGHRRGHHHHGTRRPPKGRPNMDKQVDASSGATAQPSQERSRPELTEEQKAKFEEKRKEQKAAREAYEAELQNIMTPEQFKQYKSDKKKHGRHGHRPPHDANK